jgi:hypothetical protein
VCLMPFAMNKATEYINPTKALEYMATGTPIVSTPVADVVSNFGTVVKIGHNHDDFIELCRQCVQEWDAACVQRGLKQAQDNTWDQIILRLEQHMADAINAKQVKSPLVSTFAKNSLQAFRPLYKSAPGLSIVNEQN